MSRMHAVLTGLVLLLTLPAAAEVYRWVDQNGTVHYSSSVPPDVKATKVERRTEPRAGQIYRWVDEKGTVHYSNEAPPAEAKATRVEPDPEPRAPVAESEECYTVRCQGERLELRLSRRDSVQARLAEERAAAKPRVPRGLDPRKYVALRRGMTETELIGVAGEPDLVLWDSRTVKTYTYYPTPAHPSTTMVTLVQGRVTEIERLSRH
jgi:hypothetical protein